MIKELRYDVGGLLRPPVMTPQGFLRVDGYAARPGVYVYVQDDGSVVRELRPDDEVFKAKTMGGFEGAPLTNLHPRQLVDTRNVRAYEVGTSTGPARRDGDLVVASMVIKDSKTIKQVQDKELLELSPGYKVRIDKQSGVDPKYGAYDQIQRDIEINHLALVPQARGGHDLRVRMDAAAPGRTAVKYAVMRRDAASTQRPSPAASAPPAQRGDCGVLVTDDVEGHQHTIDPRGNPWDGNSWATVDHGDTSWSMSEGAEDSHSHGWVRDPDGSIRVLENAGHSHKVLQPNYSSSAGRADRAQTGGAAPPRPRQGAGTAMDPQEQIRQLTAQLADARREIDTHKTTATSATARADAADARGVQLEKRINELEEKLDQGAHAVETEAVRAQADRADAAEAQIREFDSRFDSAVAVRTDILRKGFMVMGAEFDPGAGLTNRQIEVMVIKRLDGKADVSDRVSDAAIHGTFETLIELRGATARSYKRIGDAVARADALKGGGGTANNDAEDASSKRLHQWRNQWKRGLDSEPSTPNQRQAARGGR